MTRWLAHTPALLDLWYPGQEGGHALAAILFGDANPSGHLPVTLPVKFEDSPAAANYPGTILKVNYAEGIYVGYRYFLTTSVPAAFPFGFGLSYTTFQLSNLKIAPPTPSGQVHVTAQVTNTGTRAGAQVVQLYIHDGHAAIDRPERELKAFTRVELAPGQSRTAEFNLNPRSFAWYNTQTHDWAVTPGTFTILVGTSAVDLPLTGTIALK